MPSMQQQSRRWACERCRKYKLRCERDPRREGTCERCRKTAIPCVAGSITASVAGGPAARSANPTAPRAITPGTQRREPHSLVPRPSTQSLLSSGPPRPRIDSISTWTEPVYHEHDSAPSQKMALDSLMSPMSMALSLGHITFPEDCGPQAVGSNPHDTSEQQNNYSSAEPSEFAELNDFVIDPLHLGEEEVSLADPTNSLQELFSLSEQLVEDSKFLRSVDLHQGSDFPNPPNCMEELIQRLLERSSCFCEILNGSAQVDMREATGQPGPPYIQSQSQAGNGSLSTAPISNGTSAAQTPVRVQCMVQTTTLVTAYILLIRNWRQTFLLLHRLISSAADSQAGMRVLSALVPGLRLGGFQVQNKPEVQIAVLLELSSEMILQIEAGLGIDSCQRVGKLQDNTSVRKGAGAQHSERWPESLITGPVPVSIREMLLSQEQALLNSREGLDRLPLREIMKRIGEQVRFDTRSSFTD